VRSLGYDLIKAEIKQTGASYKT